MGISRQPVAEFLRDAQHGGERSVAIARIVACAVFLAMHVPFRLGLLSSGDFKSWLLITALAIGLGYSLATLVWVRRGWITSVHLHVSLAVDAVVIYVTLAAAVVWPHPAYAGILREHELVIVYLAIIGAGIRLSERGALVGAAIHGLGLAGLLVLDRRNLAHITYDATEVVFAVAFFGVAAIVAYSIAHRTRDLVVRGAQAAVMAERARQRLGVYVSEEVATGLLDAGDLHLGGAAKHASVLFSDLRGFTRYAETLAPERLVDELNAYLHAMVAEIRGEGGVVDKYIGDAIMAVFGVPHEHPDAPLRAIRAAMRMRGALVRHNLARQAEGLPALVHGIGVHHGSMVAGNIGTADRMQYTVIGDAVNLASRLESATKAAGVDILISGETIAAAQATGQALPVIRPCGTVPLRGRAQPSEIFSVGTDADDLSLG